MIQTYGCSCTHGEVETEKLIAELYDVENPKISSLNLNWMNAKWLDLNLSMRDLARYPREGNNPSRINVVNWIKKPTEMPWKLSSLIMQIHKPLGSILRWDIEHILGSANEAADNLAKEGALRT
ncbi:Uncharacterized protein TCM_037557 [Theobroma cacao]|uniref:RNase H type-1 domain-containing protein n=1 Tax=Theobroma cacao TaxID=3641 RepID=A0A061GT51_THECC|nr:Uncharacterized protein TCM_037557 [Theobroma cacao]